MSNIDKQALREAAAKVGSDKWQAKKINGDFYVIRSGSYEKQSGITSYQPIAEIDHKPVRDFVAAANPATVLALLDELEAAEKRIAELPGQKRLIGWRMADYTDETADPALAKNWATAVDVLPIFEGDVNTKLSAAAAGKGE